MSTPLRSYTLTLAVAVQSSMANLRKHKESAGSSAGTGVEGCVAVPSTPDAILDDLEARKEWVLDSIAQARGRGEPRAEHVALHYATLVDTCSKVRWEVHDAFPAKYAARDCVFEPGGASYVFQRKGMSASATVRTPRSCVPSRCPYLLVLWQFAVAGSHGEPEGDAGADSAGAADVTVEVSGAAFSLKLLLEECAALRGGAAP
jgi:hypothetical protein